MASLGFVRMWPGIAVPVAVGRPAAYVTALFDDLRPHRCQGAVPGS